MDQLAAKDRRIAELEAVTPSALKEKLRSAEDYIKELEIDRAKLNEIKQHIWDYFKALDDREHGGMAQESAFCYIKKTLGMYWHSGITKAQENPYVS